MQLLSEYEFQAADEIVPLMANSLLDHPDAAAEPAEREVESGG